MANKLIRIGGYYTLPEVPYQPARPAYTTYRTYTGYRVSAAGTGWYRLRVPVVNADGSIGYTEELHYDPSGVSSGSTTSYTYTVATEHPATPEVPGSPAIRVDRPPAGWTSFARSIAFAYENVEISFKVRETVSGVAIGLSENPAPVAGYAHIPRGLLLSNGTVRNLRSGASLGSFISSDLFEMELDGGAISFKKNGVEIGTDTGSYSADLALYLSAALYGAGDSVEDPVITQLAGASPAATEIEVRARMAPMVAAGAARAGGWVRATMLPLTAGGYGGSLPVTPTTEAHARMSPMSAASLLNVGGLIEVRARMAPLFAISSAEPQMIGRARMAPMTALSYIDTTPGMLYLLDGFAFDVRMSETKRETVALPIAFGFDVEMTERLGQVLTLPMAFGFGVPMVVTEEATEVLPLAFGFDVELSAPGAELEVHAINLDGFGSTTYVGYPFNSFARIGDKYYGAKLDGLFLLEGDSDAGAPIQAAICPGTLDFGTSQEKTIAEAFIGAASDSCMVLKIAAADGQELLYAAESHSSDLRQHRFKLGKGLKANYLTPVFYNQDGADFEVDSLEFSVATLSRKT